MLYTTRPPPDVDLVLSKIRGQVNIAQGNGRSVLNILKAVLDCLSKSR